MDLIKYKKVSEVKLNSYVLDDITQTCGYVESIDLETGNLTIITDHTEFVRKLSDLQFYVWTKEELDEVHEKAHRLGQLLGFIE